MLLRLRHPAVIRRHDEEREVDRAQTCDHVADEILVPGDIDQAERKPRKLEVSKAKIDRDAAGLFLRQAIGIDSGERFDQRGLPVVDVAGSGENEILLCHDAIVRPKRNAAATISSCAGKMVRRSSRYFPRTI